MINTFFKRPPTMIQMRLFFLNFNKPSQKIFMNELFVLFCIIILWFQFSIIWSSDSSTQIIIEKPNWATGFGNDKYGVWSDLEVNKINQRFRWIPPATFLMGRKKTVGGIDDTNPQKQVEIKNGYWIGDTEVTRGFWIAVMDSKNPLNDKKKQYPMDNVSWVDCSDFFKKLNSKNKFVQARFLTSAEWEYACRAGSTEDFSTGATIATTQANFCGCQGHGPHLCWPGEFRNHPMPVKSFPCNLFGIYEMHGNLAEWCDDERIEEYQGERIVKKCVRGGDYRLYAGFCRSSAITWDGPQCRDKTLGFRICISE